MFQRSTRFVIAFAATIAVAIPALAQEDASMDARSLGYAVEIVPAPDGVFPGQAMAVVERDGFVAYRYRFVSDLPDAYPAPPADLTGNGLPNLVLRDLTSRSTTDFVVLELGPRGVRELAVFGGVHFTQDFGFEDIDGDGVLEAVVTGGDSFAPELLPGAEEGGTRRIIID